MKLFLDADVLFTAAHNPGDKAVVIEGEQGIVTGNRAQAPE